MEMCFRMWLNSLLFNVLLVTQTATNECSETCVELVLANKKHHDNVVEVSKDNYVNISFLLRTDKCNKRQDWLRVKVLAPGVSLVIPICTFVFQNNTCTATDLSLRCYCLPKGKKIGWMYKKVSRLENSFKLDLSTSITSAATQCLFVNVTGHSKEGDTTPGTLEIIGICCGLGAVLVIVCAGVIFVKTRTSGGNTAKHGANHGSVIHYEVSPCAEFTEVRPADENESSEDNKYYDPVFPMDLVLRSLKKQLNNEA